MAAVGSALRNSDTTDGQNGVIDRLKIHYPAVNEEKTPLPRSWSPKEKYSYIGLSQNNLRVHYKGHGKTHRDAASVQATHPIPASCGLYYFEVKIVSKGRDGYMGIGLSAQGVNMNRLPGWDKHSYGYHGDDGNSFCSSGSGQPYGPTFTTGDIIGCGVNLIDNSCFYTKNGYHLGIAFTDLPPNLYPTVGLQTPGEIVDANFGQEPFMFDIRDMVNELKARTRCSINDFTVPESQGEWQAILNKMVFTYLIHNGFSSTAQAFAQITDQPFNEDISSIKSRQRILKLVLEGRMGEAIDRTSRIYPGLLESNQNLLFMLKCRQFVEMVNGSDIDSYSRNRNLCCSPSFNTNSSTSSRPFSPIQTSVIQSTKVYSNTNLRVDEINQNNVALNGDVPSSGDASISNANTVIDNNDSGESEKITTNTPQAIKDDSDVEMDTTDEINGQVSICNGKNNATNSYQNGNCHPTVANNFTIEDEEEMDVDISVEKKSYVKPPVERVERILDFGRELYTMSNQLHKESESFEHNQKMLEDAFSLLAYSNPWSSPVGWQLDPVQREKICASLNSAILESNDQARKPPLEVAMSHAAELVRLMSSAGLGSCAFASLADLLDN